MCKRCWLAEESEHHLFFECVYARQIWRASGLSSLIINNTTTTLEEKIDVCLQICSSTRFTHFQDLPYWILWRLWKSRNVLIFQNKQTHWRSLLNYAINDAREWKKESETMEYVTSSPIRNCNQARLRSHWKRPPTGWIKCNVDGAFTQPDLKSQAGWVIGMKEAHIVEQYKQ